jgi:arabinose-5-phosphate isomerase
VTDNYQKVVDLLKLEAAAIESAASRLERGSVVKALEILSCCDSKVIVTGVGKSGIIAQKIAQTMTSTGTIAVFVHPSDALHGSLGVVSAGDVIIAISNSGETGEILSLLPALKAKRAVIIAIVGNLKSTLAAAADAVLDASVDQEACPLNLAPTASTTVALTIGDALAMTLSEAKGYTVEDFALNHPAGRLGKRLTLKVADLMRESPGVSPETSWLDVVHALSRFALGAVNVVERDGKLIGIVTEGDLRRAIETTAPEEFGKLTARRMMTAGPVVARPEMLAFDALKLMEDRPKQIAVLPVVENGQTCVGLLRLHDIVKSGL